MAVKLLYTLRAAMRADNIGGTKNTFVYHVTTEALWKAVTVDTCTHGSGPPCGVKDGGLVNWFCDHLPSSPSKSLRSEDPETTGNISQKSSELRIC